VVGDPAAVGPRHEEDQQGADEHDPAATDGEPADAAEHGELLWVPTIE
jgi:hypothetical protein